MAKVESESANRIITDAAIMAGKPVVRGTRIPVETVLEYLANNPNFNDLFADYPRLTFADVQACFAYARSAVDKERRREASATRPRDTRRVV